MSYRQFVLAKAILQAHNVRMFKNALYITGLAAIVAPAFAAAEWMTDLEAAKTKAAAENKAVLVDFTGSDWCGWCIKLKKDVFSTPEFEKFAADKFVLVEIDVPRDKSIVGGPEQYAKNAALCEQYGVDGFPTIMVMTPAGEIAGGFVGGADMQIATASLDAAYANVKTLVAAQSLQGVEKAKALMTVYKGMGDDFADARKSLRSRIAEADTENATGIQDEVKAEAQLDEIKQKLQAVEEGDYDGMIAVIDAALPTALPANVQMLNEVKGSLLQYKSMEMLQKAQSAEDVLAVKAYLLDKFVPLFPAEEQESVKAEIEKEFADPEAVLAKVKAEAAAAAEPAAPDFTDEEMAVLESVMTKLREAGEDVDACFKIIDEAMSNASEPVMNQLRGWKMMLVMQKVQQLALKAQTVEDVLAIKSYMMDTLMPMLPEAERAEAIKELETEFADPAAMLANFKELQSQMLSPEVTGEPEETPAPAETPAPEAQPAQ